MAVMAVAADQCASGTFLVCWIVTCWHAVATGKSREDVVPAHRRDLMRHQTGASQMVMPPGWVWCLLTGVI
jgi:hypothetical protein